MSGQPISRPLASAIAGFALLCGVLLLWIDTGSGDDPAPPSPYALGATSSEAVDERLVEALEAAQRARRAADSANYGDVQRHLNAVERELTAVLAEGRRPGN